MIVLDELRLLSLLLDEALEHPVARRLAWLEKRPDIPGHLRDRLRLLLAPGCSGYVLPPLPTYDEMSWPDMPDHGVWPGR